MSWDVLVRHAQVSLAEAEIARVKDEYKDVDVDDLIKSIKSKPVKEAIEWAVQRLELDDNKIRIRPCYTLTFELYAALQGLAEHELFVDEDENEPLVVAAVFNDLLTKWAIVFETRYGECVRVEKAPKLP